MSYGILRISAYIEYKHIAHNSSNHAKGAQAETQDKTKPLPHRDSKSNDNLIACQSCLKHRYYRNLTGRGTSMMHKSVVKLKDSIVAKEMTFCGTHLGPGRIEAIPHTILCGYASQIIFIVFTCPHIYHIYCNLSM